MRIRARNIRWFFLSLSMLIVAMASWVEHPGPSLAAATKDGAGWRVLIYMAADNDLEPAAHSNLLELNDALRSIEIPLVIQSRARQQPPDVRSNLLEKIESLPLISRGARSVDMGAVLDVFEAEMPRETIVARDAYTRAILVSEGSREFLDATGLSIERSALRDSIERKVFDAR